MHTHVHACARMRCVHASACILSGWLGGSSSSSTCLNSPAIAKQVIQVCRLTQAYVRLIVWITANCVCLRLVWRAADRVLPARHVVFKRVLDWPAAYSRPVLFAA